MKISLIINTMKKDTEEYKNLILSELDKWGIETIQIPQMNYEKEIFAGSDFIITLGGDGTILRTAGILRGIPIPILGINTGHLGYLTEISKREEITAAIEALLSGAYFLDKRAMLTGELLREGERIAEGIALNEILLSRKEGINILHFAVSCDGQELSPYSSDGIIIATPTGSTAYNLSAGGPIVSPSAPVYLITPICAHSLNDRSVIMDDDKVLEIRAESDASILAFDGENIQSLKSGDVIRIQKAKEETLLVKLKRGSFLETLKNKMAGV